MDNNEIIKKAQAEQHNHEIVQMVGFKLENEEFGVDILKVQEINKLTEITRLPDAPDYMEGIINLRGKVIPVISLRKCFKLPLREDDNDARIVVVEVNGEIVGFTVDAVSEVLRIPSDRLERAPEMVRGVERKYIAGIAKLEERLLIYLDLNKILSDQEMDTIKQAA